MTRALICDPLLPERARAGELDDIRACIGCNQACIGHFHAGYPISCIQHPETGRELEFTRRRRTTTPRTVLVVGGGPGGLKAAATAAECGHDVVLHEATRRIGGQVLLAQQLPDRAEFGGAATNLLREATRAGVRIELGSPVDAGVVDALDPDLVVVATGARPYLPPLEVMGSPCLLDAWEVIDGATPGRGHVVVADWRSDWIGPGVARLLAARGLRVTLAVNAPSPGSTLQQYVRDALVRSLVREGIEVLPWVRPVGIYDDSVYLQHVLTGEPVVLDGTTGLVVACGHRARVRAPRRAAHDGPAGGRRGRRPGTAHGRGGGARGPAGRRGRGASSPAPDPGRRSRPAGCPSVSRRRRCVPGRR